MNWIYVFLLFGLFLPSNSVLYNKTYGTLEFISSRDEGESRSVAQTRCRQRGSILAEITSEHIWNRTLQFVNEIGLNRFDLLLNAHGEKLPGWQWISGDKFSDVDTYSLKNNRDMDRYTGWLSKFRNQTLVITNSFPYCEQGCYNGYVCEHPGDGSCKVTQSSDSIPLDGNCYVFHHDKSINWFEAFYECQNNNGRLATFKNIKKEEASIAQQLKHGKKYWIGLYKFKWRWADSNDFPANQKYFWNIVSILKLYFDRNWS